MWDLWVRGEVESPYEELMTYQGEINNGGHSQYFSNTENIGDVKKNISVLCDILPIKLKNNLENAYKAYMKLEQNQFDEEAEAILEECDDIFYDNEKDIVALEDGNIAITDLDIYGINYYAEPKP